MKNVIVAMMVGLFLCGTAHAEVVKTQTLTTTKLDRVEFSFSYDRTTGNLDSVELRTRSIVFDNAGNRAGAYVEEAEWSDLPQAQRTQIKPFLLWLSRRANNTAVNEDVEQTLPD